MRGSHPAPRPRSVAAGVDRGHRRSRCRCCQWSSPSPRRPHVGRQARVEARCKNQVRRVWPLPRRGDRAKPVVSRSPLHRSGRPALHSPTRRTRRGLGGHPAGRCRQLERPRLLRAANARRTAGPPTCRCVRRADGRSRTGRSNRRPARRRIGPNQATRPGSTTYQAWFGRLTAYRNWRPSGRKAGQRWDV